MLLLLETTLPATDIQTGGADHPRPAPLTDKPNAPLQRKPEEPNEKNQLVTTQIKRRAVDCKEANRFNHKV